MTRERRDLSLLAGVTLLAAALRLWRIDHLPLWSDEGFTYWAVSQSFAYIWHFIPTFDSHPPLFYTLLKLWTGAFGTGEASLRGLSALASTLTVPVAWLAGRVLGGERDGAWLAPAAAGILAVAPVQIEYAQEARPYALLGLAAAVAFTGALWLAAHKEAALLPFLGWRGRQPLAGAARLAWAALVLGAAFAAWLHNLGAFLILALGLAGLFWAWRDLAWDRRALLNAALALTLVALLWSPFLVRFVAQSEDLAQDLWIPPPDGTIILKALDFLYGTRFLRGWPALWPLLALAGLGIAALAWRGRASLAVILACGVLAPFGLSLLVSVTVRSIFLDRTLLWTTIPFSLALAAALLPLPRRWWARGTALLLVLALLGAGTQRYYVMAKKEPWNRLTREMVAGWQPDDLLVVMPEFQDTLVDYYARREGRRLPTFVMPLPTLLPDPEIGGPAAIMTLYEVGERDIAALRTALPAKGRVWLVLRRPDLYDPQGLTRGLMAAQGRPLLKEERLFGRSLWLYLYGEPAAQEQASR